MNFNAARVVGHVLAEGKNDIEADIIESKRHILPLCDVISQMFVGIVMEANLSGDSNRKGNHERGSDKHPEFRLEVDVEHVEALNVSIIEGGFHTLFTHTLVERVEPTGEDIQPFSKLVAVYDLRDVDPVEFCEMEGVCFENHELPIYSW